jgi:hypothetical protein
VALSDELERPTLHAAEAVWGFLNRKDHLEQGDKPPCGTCDLSHTRLRGAERVFEKPFLHGIRYIMRVQSIKREVHLKMGWPEPAGYQTRDRA